MRTPSLQTIIDSLRSRLGIHRLARDRGAVAVMVSIMMMPVIMASCAVAIDIANWYYQARKMQTAVDAAALAGSVYMPGSLSTATAQARAAAKANGFDYAVAGTSVTVTAGSRTSQLRVTVTHTVNNAFGYVFGRGTQGLTRTAVAEYRGPVLMGSPCNIFGNEPSNGNGEALASSGCTSTPQFWANIAGPGTAKANGNQFATRTCTASTSGCTSSTNTDYSPLGYFFKLSVTAAVSSIKIQAFDPVFVNTGQHCDTNLSSTWSKDKPNDYETVTGDAANRYKSGDGVFCTGDGEFSSGSGSNAVTTMAVREPIASQDPLAAPVRTACTQQFKGWGGGSVGLTSKLDKSNAGYVDALAKGFRQWVTLCTIDNPTIGDYYVQVRSNLPYGTSTPANLTSSTEYSSVNWNANNNYSLRAKVTGTASNVSIGGYGQMAIFANNPATDGSFYLARISSASAGMSLDINLFDAGDAATAGTLTIVPPTDGKSGTSPLVLNNCYGFGAVVGSSTTGTALNTSCQLTNVSSTTSQVSGVGYQGKLQVIRISLPADYSCTDTDPNGCWFKIRFQFPGSINDVTTWSTDLVGQPVRLVE